MAGLHGVVVDVVIVERFLKVPIYAPEVGVEDLGNVIQLTADATG